MAMGVARAGRLAAVVALCGCAAAPPPAQKAAEAWPARGTLAIVATASDPPASNLRAFARSRPAGAAQGAAIEGGAAAGAIGLAGIGASGIGAGVLAFMAPYVVAASAVAGGVTGALAALPEEKSQAMEAALRDALARLDMQQALAARVVALTRRDTGIVAGEAASGADSVLEVDVREVGFDTCGPGAARSAFSGCIDDRRDPGVHLYVQAQARWQPAAGGATPAVRQATYVSPRRPFSRWAADGGRVLAEEFDRAYDELADRIVGAMLLAPPFELRDIAGAGRLPGSDPRAGLCGLAPRQPAAAPLTLSEAIVRSLSPNARTACLLPPLRFPSVESLQPTLRWEPFPRELDRTTPAPPWLEGIGDVRYDLRVWEADGCTRGALVVERTGLVEPEHRVETPLRPGQRYFWTFRARFALDGQTRSTAWAFFDPATCRVDDRVPLQAHRFATP